MRHLHIIMPMAGEGSRFSKAGWTTPKPLIMLNGQPLFKHAISSVADAQVPMKYSFIVRQEHITKYAIDAQIRQFLPEAQVFAVEHTTRGAVETCLMAEAAIADDDAPLVMDCDLEFRSRQFNALIAQALSQPAPGTLGGALVSFEASDPRYSYAEVDAHMRVLRTAEKEVISHHALCGAYFFGSGASFKRIAHQLLAEPEFKKPEYYVSLLYNYLLAEGQDIRLCPMELYRSYGTPEELQRYL